MNNSRYILEIEELLCSMAELERELLASKSMKDRQQILRSLKNKEKRLDHLTPFKYRLSLRNICNELNIKHNFL